ncbi:Transposon TX1 uncharacterized protein, partial [Choanephora cucurbitarum]
FSCWTCGANGHMAASCPKDAPQKKAKVKAPVVPKLDFNFSERFSTSQTETSAFKSSIWHPDHGSNSVFIDMTGRKEFVADFFLLVAHQYPSRVGVLPQKVGNLRYAEICFDDDDDEVAKFSCWTCGANGHMAASCPKDAPQKKAKVKAPVVPKLDFNFSERHETTESLALKSGQPAFRDDATEESRSDSASMLRSANQFYQQLYTADPVDTAQLDEYLNEVSSMPRVKVDDHQSLLAPITIDDIIAVTAKVVSKQSSPGSDGFGYAYLYHLYRFPPLQHLVIQVYNDALLRCLFPTSWRDVRVQLLPKKGDLTLLRNWRPISLINCDAKIFPRILNARMKEVAPSVITPFQTGFMPGRFIATNGILVNMVMEHARRTQRDDVALLLDQEKAYDRVHPLYLRRTLLHLNFPLLLVDCLMNLFFGNKVRVNVNGFFSDEHILQDSAFQGFVFDQVASPSSPPTPEPLKALAYADDVCVFLANDTDFRLLQHHLARYGQVSNAKVNMHKTEAISLSGRPSSTWQSLLGSFEIHSWHDRISPQPLRYLGFPLRYLGFPLISSLSQRKLVKLQLLDSLQAKCDRFKDMNLALCGRATVVNTLPLADGFLNLPDDHWIVASRPTPLLLKYFFTIDESRNCFRSLHPPDRPRFPRLCAKLRLELLSPGISLQPRLLAAILHPPESLAPVTTQPFDT